MNKKGQAEQFNWIFVIVAGVIILAFFVLFVFKYVELQEKRQDIEVVRFFSNGILTASSKLQIGSGGAAVDSQGDDGVKFGYPTTLGYSCIGDKATVLINKGDSAWYSLKDEVVFMDKEIRFGLTDGVDLWVLPWSHPFYITNFIYLANSNKNFYFVYDSEGREIIDQLDVSSIFNVNIVQEGQLRDVLSNSKIIYFTRREPTVQSLSEIEKSKENIDFVYINRDKAKFFDGTRWSEPIQFYGLEQIYGAMFSNDAETFACNVNRTIGRSKVIAKTYAERARLLGQIDRREGCNYASVFSALNQYANGNLNALAQDALSSSGGCLWVY